MLSTCRLRAGACTQRNKKQRRCATRQRCAHVGPPCMLPRWSPCASLSKKVPAADANHRSEAVLCTVVGAGIFVDAGLDSHMRRLETLALRVYVRFDGGMTTEVLSRTRDKRGQSMRGASATHARQSDALGSNKGSDLRRLLTVGLAIGPALSRVRHDNLTSVRSRMTNAWKARTGRQRALKSLPIP